MRRSASAYAVLLALLAAAPAPAGSVGAGWRLVWEDDFGGPELNASTWNVVVSGEGSNQIELYTADNVFLTVADGRSALALRTRPSNVTWHGRAYNVTSGRVDTSFKRNITFGRTEVTARLQNDAASGLHTAHWLLGYACWPVGGEIDIMECQSPHNAYAGAGAGARVGGAGTWQAVTSNLHTGASCGVETKHSTGTSLFPAAASPAVNFTRYWTTFAAEWNATAIAYFVNETRVNLVYEGMPGWAGPVAIPQGDMFLILSQAYMARRPYGDPPEWAWPVEQLVDAVRVYEWAG
jgi:beta-glucanase (GH16 family)